MPEWMVGSGEKPRPAAGNVLRNVGLRAACFELVPGEERPGRSCVPLEERDGRGPRA